MEELIHISSQCFERFESTVEFAAVVTLSCGHHGAKQIFDQFSNRFPGRKNIKERNTTLAMVKKINSAINGS